MVRSHVIFNRGHTQDLKSFTGDDDALYPSADVRYIKLPTFKHLDNDLVSHFRTCFKSIPIYTQKNIHRSKGNSLIAVHKGVVDYEAFKQGCGLSLDVWVVARLGAVNGPVQRPSISEAR